MILKIYAHPDKDTLYERGRNAGLDHEAANTLSHLNEVSLTLEVEEKTGLAKVVAVDERPVGKTGALIAAISNLQKGDAEGAMEAVAGDAVMKKDAEARIIQLLEAVRLVRFEPNPNPNQGKTDSEKLAILTKAVLRLCGITEVSDAPKLHEQLMFMKTHLKYSDIEEISSSIALLEALMEIQS